MIGSANRRFFLPALLVALLAAGAWADDSDETAKQPVEIPGLGDPGKLTAVEFESFPLNTLVGRDARRQLVVNGRYSTGQIRDLTAKVSYQAAPEGIVRVDADGLVTPLADGTVRVTATAEGISGTTELTVERFGEHIPVNFPNQIVPIFSKLGCNTGGCHGKKSGQNGFKLSLLGFYPKEDYEYLVKESRGRRLFPGAPDRSLVLLKATNTIAHGGGLRMPRDSYEYQMLRNWIAQGTPFGSDDDPTVTSVEVFPKQRTLDRGAKQQISVVAHYSDGSMQDVTRMVQYEPNDPEMAEVTSEGVMQALDLTGQVAIMVRFMGHVAVFRASIPMGLPVNEVPQPRNYIDELVFGKLRALGIPPSPVSSDAVFVRRIYLDLTGGLPTGDQARAFIESRDPNKRDKLIDQLLDGGGYADYFANKWGTILRNRRLNNNYTRGTYSFHFWIRQSFQQDKPYDQFVREIVGASGEVSQNPPVAWYRALTNSTLQLEDTAQLFLGLRIQCARCHHHPFERWSQRDYYGFQAFFSRVGRKNGINGLRVQDEPRIFHQRGTASARNPRTDETLRPTGLGAEPLQLTDDDDPRQALADWMADPENPFFAPALVNRYWKHFFGRGIVEPEDDMRVTNPPSNPELLKALSDDFIKSGFRLKSLIRTICQSSAYQLDSLPNEYNVIDKQNFSRYYPKRLEAEVLYDALNQVTGSPTTFNGLPPGTRAVQLPDAAFNNYFLTVFGKPQGTSPCECERTDDANLAQTLHLLMSREVQGKLSDGNGRAAKLAADNERPHAERVTDLYYWAYARPPESEELALAVKYIEDKQNDREAYEDIVWALVNSKEFLFVR